MFLLTVFFALIAGGIAAFFFALRSEQETDLEPSGKMRYTALVDPLVLPICLAVWVILALVFPLLPGSRSLLTGWLIILVLYISVYYALLLCLLPLLRRIFSPRACATLWLLPNFLYLLGNFRVLYAARPLIVLTVPKSWLGLIGIVWAGGFVLVLLWQIASHLRCRHALLRGRTADPICQATNLWRSEQQRMGLKRPIPLVVSDAAATPLTIGCFARTLRLVLPHLNYTEEELRLIFRHELRHIQRMDTRTKFFLGFCTALCWFNPLMWIARRKVSDDLELSCDELVLHIEDEQTRLQYAHLLLEAAGSSKGYTTCLSAAASTMRYRLKHVVKPRKRLSGAIVVGAVLALLILGSGAIALADSPGTVGETVLPQFPENSVLVSVYGDGRISSARQEEALIEYISSLTVQEIYTDDNSGYSSHGELQLSYTVPHEDGTRFGSIRLWDGVLFANFPLDDRGAFTYELKDPVDWEYVYSLLEFETGE